MQKHSKLVGLCSPVKVLSLNENQLTGKHRDEQYKIPIFSLQKFFLCNL